MRNRSLSLIAFVALAGANCAPALAENQSVEPITAAQAEAQAAQAATEAAQAAQVAAQAAQAAAKAAQAAVQEAEFARQSAQRPQALPSAQTSQSQAQPPQSVQPSQLVSQPTQPIESTREMTQPYRTVTRAEMQSLNSQPAPSTTESVVNGASVGDFLGSGVELDRRAMDAVVDREYNSLARLSPLKPGEVAPSVDPDVENARLAEAKKSLPKQKGFKAFIHGCTNAAEDVGGMLGFPIGPDDDDARMDKFDGM